MANNAARKVLQNEPIAANDNRFATSRNQVSKVRVDRGSQEQRTKRRQGGRVWNYPRYTPPNTTQDDSHESKLTHTAGALMTKAKAAQASYAIFGLTAWTIPIHLLFGFAALAGVGGELYLENTWLGLGSYFFPGETLFVGSYAIVLVIGVCSMLTASLIFLFRGVKIYGVKQLIPFFICAALYLVPIPIPWVYVWCAVVTYTQS